MNKRIFRFGMIILVASLLIGCATEKTTATNDVPDYEVMDRGSFHLVHFSANKTKGYNFDFYIKIPVNSKKLFSRLLVSPTNSGQGYDDIEFHRAATINDMIRGWKGKIADNLNAVLLMPVFPRPYKEWQYYTHALDRDSMLLKNSSMSRLDLQLIAMIDEAKKYLSANGIVIEEKVSMFGFSACSKFTNRFTAMHPDMVRVAAVGGISGQPILPLAELNGRKLIYPIGIYDLENITGHAFDRDAFNKVPQYIFMGGMDFNDAVQHNDGYSDFEREIIYKLLDTDIQKRWQKSIELLKALTTKIEMVTYPYVGHKVTALMISDIVNFFLSNND